MKDFARFTNSFKKIERILLQDSFKLMLSRSFALYKTLSS